MSIRNKRLFFILIFVHYSSFSENYRVNAASDDVFYIKGKILESFSYGIKMKLIEDFKGSFPKDSTFVVWGGGDASLSVDPLVELNYQYDISNRIDTLVMLIKSIDSDVPFSNRRIGDFSTLDCAYSVVPIKDGKIPSTNWGWDRRHLMTPEQYAQYRFSLLTWIEFKNLLNQLNI